MKTLLQTFDRMSNYTSNLGLKFWLWPFETIIHRFYSEDFENKIFTRPIKYAKCSFIRDRFFGGNFEFLGRWGVVRTSDEIKVSARLILIKNDEGQSGKLDVKTTEFIKKKRSQRNVLSRKDPESQLLNLIEADWSRKLRRGHQPYSLQITKNEMENFAGRKT